jgi:hypothetical protein
LVSNIISHTAGSVAPHQRSTEMPILPPKVDHREKALEYISSIKTREDKSGFVALRRSITPPLSGAGVLLIFGTWMMHFIGQSNLWMGLILGGGIISFGLLNLMRVQRLVGLLELFDDEHIGLAPKSDDVEQGGEFDS